MKGWHEAQIADGPQIRFLHQGDTDRVSARHPTTLRWEPHRRCAALMIENLTIRGGKCGARMPVKSNVQAFQDSHDEEHGVGVVYECSGAKLDDLPLQ